MTKAPTIARVLWLAACAVVLIFWLASYAISESPSGASMSEAMIYVVIAMTLLAFPIGLVWTVLLAIAARLLHEAGMDIQSPLWAGLFFYWVISVALGYVQWFVVIPRLRAKRAARAQQALH